MTMAAISQGLRRLRWAVHYYLPEHEVTVETDNGLLTVNSGDWLIGKQLFVKGSYEIDLIRSTVDFLRADGLLPPGTGNTVIDIGGNIGMICIGMLLEGDFQHAIAFEPSPHSFKLLRKNVAQNGLADRIRCFDYALSSTDGGLEFELAADNSGDSRVRMSNRSGSMGESMRASTTVRSRTLDSVMKEHQVDPDTIEMIWLDIQGHEGHFFAGAREFFRARRVPVVSEFWGYGIDRSGMSREEYCQIVSATFRTMYFHGVEGFRSEPASDIGRLFEHFSKPREIASIILM